MTKTEATGPPACPQLARFWAVAAGEAWTDEEWEHIGGCGRCAEVLGSIEATGVRRFDQEGSRSATIAPASVGSWTLPPSDGEAAGLEDTADLAGASRWPSEYVSTNIPVNSRLGRFEIRGELGRGGLGAVYRAYDPELNREVAIKLPVQGRSLPSAALDRFLREARVIGSLHHPGIVPIFEAGECEGLVYIVTPLFEGETLRESQFDRTPHGYHRMASIVEMVARAVAYSHDRGILHRDLKPSNIIVSGDGLPKIIDFGLARVIEPSEEADLTHSGVALGTPAYMAPEQWRGAGGVGPAADVYSLGATLYSLLTGQPPHGRRASFHELYHQVMTEEPAPPHRIRPEVPPGLEAICLKALRKQPEDRYPSAKDMADDLRRFAYGEVVEALPVDRRRRRGSGRNRRWFLVIFLVGVVLLSIVTALLSLLAENVRSELGSETVAELRGLEAQRAITGSEPLRHGLVPHEGFPADPEKLPVVELVGRDRGRLMMLARAESRRASELGRRGRHQEARQHYEQAIRLYESLAAGHDPAHDPRPAVDAEAHRLLSTFRFLDAVVGRSHEFPASSPPEHGQDTGVDAHYLPADRNLDTGFPENPFAGGENRE